MTKKEVVNHATRSINRVGFQIKKHSPEFLAAAGVIGVVVSTILACKATTKANAVVAKAKEEIEKIHEELEHPENFTEEHTIEESKKELATVYTKTGVSLIKLYAPSVALGALSITSMLTSNHILRKRNVALAAAYTLVDRSFKTYRSKVSDRFGAELDKELRHGVKMTEVKETVVDEETGKKKTVKKQVKVFEQDIPSDYAKFFDCGNRGWSDDPEFSLFFLKRQQDYANEKLRARGHLFLNEVYDMLGIPRTKAGNCVGWVLREDNEDSDHYVDFGIYDGNREKTRDFVNGLEKVILLDFNVDGPILDLI